MDPTDQQDSEAPSILDDQRPKILGKRRVRSPRIATGSLILGDLNADRLSCWNFVQKTSLLS